jgi:hypothetical protein
MKAPATIFLQAYQDNNQFIGGQFELDISVSKDYPLQPPTVRFRTKIFHPNIHFKVSPSKMVPHSLVLPSKSNAFSNRRVKFAWMS